MKTFQLEKPYNSISEIIEGKEGQAIIAELKQGEIDSYVIKSNSGKLFAFTENYTNLVNVTSAAANPSYNPYAKDFQINIPKAIDLAQATADAIVKNETPTNIQPTIDYKIKFEELEQESEQLSIDNDDLRKQNDAQTKLIDNLKNELASKQEENICAEDKITELNSRLYAYNQSIVAVFNGLYAFEEAFNMVANEDGTFSLVLMLEETFAPVEAE